MPLSKKWFTSLAASVMLFSSFPVQGLAEGNTAPAVAEQQTDVATGKQFTQAETPVFETTDSTDALQTLPAATEVETFGTEGLFTRILLDGVHRFVKTDQLAAAPTYSKIDSRYTNKSTPLYTTAASETVTTDTLALNTAVDTYGQEGLFTRIKQGTVYQFVLTADLSATPVYATTGERFVQQKTAVYPTADANGTALAEYAVNQSVETFGTSGTFTRIKLNGRYAFILTAHLGTTKVTSHSVTGKKYSQQLTPVYPTASATGKPLGTLAQNQHIDIYGISGDYTRVRLKDTYGFVLTAHLGDLAFFEQTARLYVQSPTPIRQAASSTSPVLAQHQTNTLLTVYGTSGAYSRILFRGQHAFVLTSALAPLKAYAKTDRLYVQASTPIRQAANSSSPILKNHQTNTLLTVYGTSGAYSRILFRGQYAFVLTSALAKTKVFAKTGLRYAAKNTSIFKDTTAKTVLRSIKRAEPIEIYGTSGSFTRVKVGSVYGYLKTTDLVTKKPDLYDITGTRYVLEDKLVVHPKASLTGKIGTLKKNTALSIYGKSGYYTRVKVGTTFGFVDSSKLGLNKPAARPKVGTVFYVHFDQTPLFSADVAYSRPAAYLTKGTKLIGLKAIDDDFWQVRLPNGTTGYVINPYIGTTKPDMRYTQQAVNRLKTYTVKATTSYFATPASPKSAGLIEQGKRVYPRHRVGNFYVIQSGWSPVYLPVSAVTVTSDTRIAQKNTSRGEKLIQAAAKHLGTPYTWGSQTSANGGFDCSGLIHYATNQAGKYGGRTNVSGYWYGAFFTNRRTTISSGKRSDIVFFENTYTDGPSHIGIMLDNEYFIHAGGSQLQINSIYEPRWREHFLGFKSM